MAGKHRGHAGNCAEANLAAPLPVDREVRAGAGMQIKPRPRLLHDVVRERHAPAVDQLGAALHKGGAAHLGRRKHHRADEGGLKAMDGIDQKGDHSAAAARGK